MIAKSSRWMDFNFNKSIDSDHLSEAKAIDEDQRCLTQVNVNVKEEDHYDS